MFVFLIIADDLCELNLYTSGQVHIIIIISGDAVFVNHPFRDITKLCPWRDSKIIIGNGHERKQIEFQTFSEKLPDGIASFSSYEWEGRHIHHQLYTDLHAIPL